jgi:hypothetical protein
VQIFSILILNLFGIFCRQLAIKALNDRLNATADSGLSEESHWPGLVDEDEAPTQPDSKEPNTALPEKKSHNISNTGSDSTGSKSNVHTTTRSDVTPTTTS